jgi:hypothetical protein
MTIMASELMKLGVRANELHMYRPFVEGQGAMRFDEVTAEYGGGTFVFSEPRDGWADEDDEEDKMSAWWEGDRLVFADSSSDDEQYGADDGDDGEDGQEDEEDGEGAISDPFESNPARPTQAPMAPAGDGEEPTQEAVMKLAYQIASQRHKGYTYPELSHVEQHACLVSAISRSGYTGASTTAHYSNEGAGDDFDAGPGSASDAAITPRFAERQERRALRLARQAAIAEGKRFSDASPADRERWLRKGAEQAHYDGDRRGFLL